MASPEVLFNIAQEEDMYKQHIGSQPKNGQKHQNLDNKNTFETLVNRCYEDSDSEVDIEYTFEKLVNNMDEKQGQEFPWLVFTW